MAEHLDSVYLTTTEQFQGLLFWEWGKEHINLRPKEPESLGCSWWFYVEVKISWVFPIEFLDSWFVFGSTAEGHICGLHFICVFTNYCESSGGIMNLLESLDFFKNMKQAHILNCFKNYIVFFIAVVSFLLCCLMCIFVWEGNLPLSLKYSQSVGPKCSAFTVV